jgi:hypothetical protein
MLILSSSATTLFRHRWMVATALFGVVLFSPPPSSFVWTVNHQDEQWIPAVVSPMTSIMADAATSTSPFSSNVISLTSENWKEVVLDSPHAVFVNICRVG